MATTLDLQEQEQLDDLKAFWKQYGNFILWVLILAFGALAAWNGWNWYQRRQAGLAGAMFEELERAAEARDADKSARVFGDLRERYPRTAFAEQAGLLTAKMQVDKGQLDAAKASLAWVAEHAVEDAVRAVARLRMAGLLVQQKQYDEALKQLAAVEGEAFKPLADDRRGDVLQAQGKPEDAKAAYQAAWKALAESLEYRRLVEAKLTALGAAPVPAAGVSGGASAPSAAAASGAKP